MSSMTSTKGADDVRERILRTASDLFYREGAHAVGVDLVVERAGVAKTSLYRHFRTKDDLVGAFLEREDEEFWQQWDGVAARHPTDAQAELDAQMRWIGERVGRKELSRLPAVEHRGRVRGRRTPGAPCCCRSQARASAPAQKHRGPVRRASSGRSRRAVASARQWRLCQLRGGPGDEAVPALLAASHALIAAARSR